MFPLGNVSGNAVYAILFSQEISTRLCHLFCISRREGRESVGTNANEQQYSTPINSTFNMPYSYRGSYLEVGWMVSSAYLDEFPVICHDNSA